MLNSTEWAFCFYYNNDDDDDESFGEKYVEVSTEGVGEGAQVQLYGIQEC